MSRLRTKFPSMARCAKELARLAKSLGSGDAACLAVLARFVEPDPVRLGELVESLPREARGTWKAALRRLESSRAGPIADAIDELSDFARPALGRDRLTVDCAPVVPEGLLWELLLRELDSVGRRRRGMFFTPQPLVRFLVRSALALAERFGPDRPVHMIDPACGYGGFLIEAARQAEG